MISFYLLLSDLYVNIGGLIYPSLPLPHPGWQGTCTDLTLTDTDEVEGKLTGRLWQCDRFPGWSRRSGWAAGRWRQRNPAPCLRCRPLPAPGWTPAWQCEGSGSMASLARRRVWRWSGSNSGRWRQRGESRVRWRAEEMEDPREASWLEHHAWNRWGNVTCRKHCGVNKTFFSASVTNAVNIRIKHLIWPFDTLPTTSLRSIRWVSHCHRPLPLWTEHKGCSVLLHA